MCDDEAAEQREDDPEVSDIWFEDLSNSDCLEDEPATKKKKTTLLDHFKCNSTESDSVDSLACNNNINIPGDPSTSKENQVHTLTPEEKKIVHSTGSLRWHYFKREGKDSAKCNKCQAVRSTPTGTTKTLILHLKSHRKEYSEYLKFNEIRKTLFESKKNAEDRKELDASKQQNSTIKGKFGVLPTSSKRSQEITKAIAVWLAKGLHAFSEVNEPGFRYLIWKLEPRYVVPHRTTFSRNVVPKLFKEEKQKQLTYIHGVLESLESMTITTDLWTSRHQDSFLAATVQFVVNNESDDIFDLKHLTLDLIPFPGHHTADKICEASYEIVRDLGVDPDEVKVYMVTDNGSNMVAALEEPTLQKVKNDKLPSILRESKPWNHKRCVDHTLQLAIHDSRKEIGAHTVIDKVIIIVNRYSWSNIALENLFKKQEETNTPKHEIVKNVVTRWNSEFLMLDRFLEQKIPITLELADAGEESLTAQQWKLVEGYVEVLRPIAMFTAELGSTTQPTLSMVIPVLFEIKNCLEDFIKKPSNKGAGISFARILLKNMAARFPKSNYENNPMYQLATILDPRFKDLLFPQAVAVKLLEEAALEKHRSNIKRGRVKASIDSSQQSVSAEAPDTSAKKRKWGHLHRIQRHSDKEILDITNIIHNEVKTYLAMPPIDADKGNAVLWWKSNRKTFPHLVDLAAEYLGIPATEVQSERDFSAAGNTVTPKRTNLLTEHIREMVFLHRNLNVPSFPQDKSSDVFCF